MIQILHFFNSQLSRICHIISFPLNFWDDEFWVIKRQSTNLSSQLLKEMLSYDNLFQSLIMAISSTREKINSRAFVSTYEKVNT